MNFDVEMVSDSIPITRPELEQSVPDRFEKIVCRVPDRMAVKMGEDVVSYAQLNATANRLGRAVLALRGNKTESVGVLVDRGVALPAAMLGVLKAGKSFVQLDPSFPTARIAATLADFQAELVVTDRQNRGLAEALRGDSRVILEFESMDSTNVDDLRLPISPSSLACIVYTSGSTGEPKGVVRNHQDLLHSAMLQTIVTPLSVRDRVTLLTSATGSAISTTFFTLLSGAALFPFDVRKDGLARLAQWLANEGISVGLIASPLFRRLCESLRGEERFPHLRLLRLTSENVYKTDVDLFKKHFSANCTLLTGLMSTEAGPVTANKITGDTTIGGSDVPVGSPLPDKEIVLLDDAGNKVGFNEVGEIAVRSRYLCRGYWRKPELTRSKFRPDPEYGEETLYLTGDLGMVLPDGRLVHKGRKDFRVKIRGNGVDIAEVQTALIAHPAVSDAVVIPSKNELGESRLVAFFTSRVRPAPNVSELRKFLKQTLAAYMIPSQFVTLDTLPLTPDGKIDRSALRIPDFSRLELGNVYASARTTIEKKLVQIWSKVLAVDPIGIHDDFFDLGGDSLAAASLIAELKGEFDVDLPIGALVYFPTIERLGRHIETERLSRESTAAYSLVQLQSGNPGKPVVFFIPGGIGGDSEFFVYARLSRHIGSEYSVFGLKSRSAEGTQSSQTSVQEMAQDYIRAIRSFQPGGPYYVIGECSGGIVAYEIAQQMQTEGEKIALLMLMDAPRPDFSLEVRRRLKGLFHPILTNQYVIALIFVWGQLRKRTLREKIRYLINKSGKFVEGAMAVRHNRAIEHVQDSYSRAIYAYRPKPYTGKITLLVHEEFDGNNKEPTLGWKGLVSGGIERHALAGNHETYIREHVQAAAREIRECIERAERQVNS
jgi:amino acid adenylation domain-containing protein